MNSFKSRGCITLSDTQGHKIKPINVSQLQSFGFLQLTHSTALAAGKVKQRKAGNENRVTIQERSHTVSGTPKHPLLRKVSVFPVLFLFQKKIQTFNYAIRLGRSHL